MTVTDVLSLCMCVFVYVCVCVCVCLYVCVVLSLSHTHTLILCHQCRLGRPDARPRVPARATRLPRPRCVASYRISAAPPLSLLADRLID